MTKSQKAKSQALKSHKTKSQNDKLPKIMIKLVMLSEKVQKRFPYAF
jgi:hypothetical protein